MNENAKRYLQNYNQVYTQTKLLGIDPLNLYTKYKLFFVGWTEAKATYCNIASLVTRMTNDNYVAIEYNKDFYSKHTVCVTVCLSIDEEISQTTFELLKDFKDKKSYEFEEHLDYALLNGHITFKQYNELRKEVQ